jgi:hypothetical protein
MLVFYFRPSFENCCPPNLLSGSTLHLFIQCIRWGGGVWVSGPQTDKHLPHSPLLGQFYFFRWRHVALPLYESYHSTCNCNAMAANTEKKRWIHNGTPEQSWLPYWFLLLNCFILYVISQRRQNVVAELREGFPVSLVRKLKEKVKGVLSDRFVWLRVQGQGEGVHCKLGQNLERFV